MAERTHLREASESMGLSLAPAAIDRLLAYRDLIVKWNRVYNLTAVQSPSEMVSRHLLDSLSVLPFITRGPVLDVGSGAGLPGIPLAIALPEFAFTLLDTATKRTRFMTQAVAELGVRNVEVVTTRIEELARISHHPSTADADPSAVTGRAPGPLLNIVSTMPSSRSSPRAPSRRRLSALATNDGEKCGLETPQSFAVITSRAFTSLPDFVHHAAPYLRDDGRLVAMKGQLHDAELQAIDETWHVDVSALDYPGRNGERHAVILSRPVS